MIRDEMIELAAAYPWLGWQARASKGSFPLLVMAVLLAYLLFESF